jgi:hypothetical protein
MSRVSIFNVLHQGTCGYRPSPLFRSWHAQFQIGADDIEELLRCYGVQRVRMLFRQASHGQRSGSVRPRRYRVGDAEEGRERETAKLYSKIGELTTERDFFARRPFR